MMMVRFLITRKETELRPTYKYLLFLTASESVILGYWHNNNQPVTLLDYESA